MKTAKPISVVTAAMLALSVNVLVAASPNRLGSIFTNEVAPPQNGSSDAAGEAPLAGISTYLPTPAECDAVTTVSNAPSFSAEVCCSEARTGDFKLRAEALTQTPTGASAHRTVHFFRSAVISVGRAGDSPEWRDRELATFDRYPANVSWAGGDVAARIEPRGLKLFNWSW